MYRSLGHRLTPLWAFIEPALRFAEIRTSSPRPSPPKEEREVSASAAESPKLKFSGIGVRASLVFDCVQMTPWRNVTRIQRE